MRRGDDGDEKPPYRMTSTLTLHSAQARGEEPDPARQFWRDPFDKGKLVASDSQDHPVKRQGRRLRRMVARDRFDELMAPVYLQLARLREIALAPVRLAAQRLDVILDGAQGAGMIWEQLVSQLETYLFQPRRVPESPADGEPLLPEVKPVSFCDLWQYNVQFMDNTDTPLYNFEGQRRAKYAPSPMVVDPMATEKALVAIRECADRAQGIPPATEGRYAGIPLGHVLFSATAEDLQGFLRYVKAFPGNYVGRNLKVSETFATWVVYGAPEP